MARRLSYLCRFCRSECCTTLLKPPRSLWVVCGRCGAAACRRVGPLIGEWKASLAGFVIVALGLVLALAVSLDLWPRHDTRALWSSRGLALALLVLLTAAGAAWALPKLLGLAVGRVTRRPPRS